MDVSTNWGFRVALKGFEVSVGLIQGPGRLRVDMIIFKLAALSVGVRVIRALVFGVYIGALIFWTLTNT